MTSRAKKANKVSSSLEFGGGDAAGKSEELVGSEASMVSCKSHDVEDDGAADGPSAGKSVLDATRCADCHGKGLTRFTARPDGTAHSAD